MSGVDGSAALTDKQRARVSKSMTEFRDNRSGTGLHRGRQGRRRAPDRGARPRRRLARAVLARRFQFRHAGHQGAGAGEWAAEHGRACVRFDYSGHGESGGAFVDGTIGRWLEESVAVFEQFCDGPQVVIGSSMGGWMALLLAREIARRRDQARRRWQGWC